MKSVEKATDECIEIVSGFCQYPFIWGGKKNTNIYSLTN